MTRPILRPVLLSLPVALMAALPVAAQDATTAPPAEAAAPESAAAAGEGAPVAAPALAGSDLSGLWPASEAIDKPLYAVSLPNGDWSLADTFTAVPAEWVEIGEVEDIMLDPEGQVVGVLAEIGGFLGLGDHEVLLEPAELRAVRVNNDIFYVTRYSEDALRELPQAEGQWWDD
ncbi:PRC-barrel domain-containing protein [Frigidibacter oleivorans]|uniref:PRC-barrel domain-containing protein n=1 Tax=Frigidibacter oleivorans TaxID=2487129 RepID=UPI0013E0061E|nr:PRC-barrel domain-containing protein [Frigidibacter oleivorans]